MAYKNDIKMSTIKFYWDTSCSFIDMLCEVIFRLQRQNWIVLAETRWPVKPKGIVIRLFVEKVCRPSFNVDEAVPLSLGGWVGRCICGERKLRWDFCSTGAQQILGIPSLVGWEFLLTNDLPLFINLFQATQLISEHKNTLVAHKLAFSTIIYKRDKESIYISNLLHSI